MSRLEEIRQALAGVSVEDPGAPGKIFDLLQSVGEKDFERPIALLPPLLSANVEEARWQMLLALVCEHVPIGRVAKALGKPESEARDLVAEGRLHIIEYS